MEYNINVFIALAVALACGLLVGLEREKSGGDDFGGIRTFALIGLVGALTQLLSATAGSWLVGLGLFGVLGWLAIYYYERSRDGKPGMTSEFAALITFFCGVLAMQHQYGVAFAISIVVTAILALKMTLHHHVSNLNHDDINSTLKFLLIAFVMLPLLPDKTFVMNVPAELLPGFIDRELLVEVINPRKVGLMIVLIAGISFVGYVLSKLMSAQRGIGLTALFGGLASSTAVTLSFAGLAKNKPQILNICVMAILLASTVMFFRVIVEVAVVAPGLLNSVLKPIGAMALTGVIVCLFFWLKRGDIAPEHHNVQLVNPFRLDEAFKFGAFFALILMVADITQKMFGSSGLYVSALLAGLTDVDAITLSAAQLTKNKTQPISHQTAATAITIASLANTVVKGGMAYAIGGKILGMRVITAFLIISFVGIITILFL